MNLPMGPRIVRQPDSIVFDTRSAIRRVAFICVAEARPLPSYVWYLTHDQRRFEVDLTDQSKTVTNGRLTIDDPSQTEDNGDYQCVAGNSLGAILSNFASLSFGCKIIFSIHISVHRRSQGVQWMHLQPQGREKNFRCNLQGKFVIAPRRTPSALPGRARVNYLGHFFAVRGRFGATISSFRPLFEGND